MRPALRTLSVLAVLLAQPVLALNAGLKAPPDSVERENPSVTVHGFLNAAHAGKYAVAAHYLDLDFLPAERQAVEGPRLARRLKFVLDRKVWIDFAEISKEPGGDPAHATWDQVGAIPLDNTNQPLRVSRVPADGELAWVFSRETVKAIDRLYAVYGPPLGDSLPDVLFRHAVLELEPWQWMGLVLVLALATALALLGEKVLLAVGRRAARLTALRWDARYVEAGHGPLRLPLWAGLVATGTRQLLLTPTAQRIFDVTCRSLLIVSVSWFALRVLGLISSNGQSQVFAQEELLGGPVDDPRLQGMRTQLTVLRRVASVAIYVVSGALILTQFEVVRHIGVSLLASAGLAGLVLGVAAQRSIAALLAGLQLSITRPICLGDTVVVEGESGLVEEITLTYVVMKLWDQRRMVIPMNYFLEKPFQNWSKGPHDLLATATLRTHGSADVDAFRAEMKRTLESEAKGLWDGRMPNLIVTEVTDHSLLLRAVAGAANSASASELRRILQRRLEGLLQAHPEWLPASLGQKHAPPGAPPAAAH